MQCPVCQEKARNITPNTMDGVVVACGQCGDYRIPGAAFHGFMQLEMEKRAAALKAAKLTSRSGWPMISRAAAGSR